MDNTQLRAWQSELELAIENTNNYLQGGAAIFDTCSLPPGDEDELRASPGYLTGIENDLYTCDEVLQKVTAAKFALLALKRIAPPEVETLENGGLLS